MAVETTSAQLQAKFDLGISLTLYNWQALSIAVDNEWGGQDSQDKRDWFAGAISDLFSTNSETDEQDLEDMLLQILEDEFELALDDGSEAIVAASIMRLKDQISNRDFTSVDRLWEAFNKKKQQQQQQQKDKAKVVRMGPASDDEHSVDDESGSDDDDEEMIDIDTNTQKQPPKPKAEPEIDEDGFTKVVGRRR